MADSRLHQIYFHAGRLFNQKRYANTKVSEIAAAAGVATGTMYLLFENKRAILTFVIRAGLDPDYLKGDISLPIPQTDISILVALIQRYFDDVYSNLLRVADQNGKIDKPFSAFIEGIFDMNADSLLATNNIEHNSDILPELWGLFNPTRERFFTTFQEIIMQYSQARLIRPITYPRVHVQSILDILTWWAMNAYIALPDISVPREEAKQIAIDLVVAAYRG